MAVFREAPKCPICGEEYEGIYRGNLDNIVGDNFIMWDTERHVCKSDENHVLTRYEERLERIVDTIRNVPTLEAIIFLKKYVPPLPNEEE
jgi:hypothetical protein